MNIKQKVPSLDTCKRLKAAGFPQDTYFKWVKWSENDAAFTVEQTWKLAVLDGSRDYYDICAAPDVSELLCGLMIRPKEFNDSKRYDALMPDGSGIYNDNPAEALVQLWLELNKKK